MERRAANVEKGAGTCKKMPSICGIGRGKMRPLVMEDMVLKVKNATQL